ncbi:MAG: type I-U CRISPR-associated helicase/endonuclease Cas3 [Vicinamibacterales bacterium]
MSNITIDRFDDYYRELHQHDAYSWQRRLAARVVAGDWPPAIDLPTGSGKTACIDIAVFAMACQAGRPVAERTVPRRVFFCVNRRIIVDEAHQRAKRIAQAIWHAERVGPPDKPVLRDVASALRMLAGTDSWSDTPPLDVLELRGGIYRDNRWARSATQPAVVCTTIDQLGSRLLFRGYGVSPNAAPIQAALIAYESLILLDEAHISRPFFQTLIHVKRYLDPDKWAERGIGVRGVQVVPMTATPPEGVSIEDVIGLDANDRRNESLDRRLRANKVAELVKGPAVADEAVKAATKFTEDGPAAVGVIVNRIATARAVYTALRTTHPDAALELVIGSMRPVDRDKQADRLRALVGRDRPVVTTQTSFVVATQCLEVGADYDFDALVTECASLDALRQRFGRLNRGGRVDAKGEPFQAEAVILIAKGDIKPDEKLDDDAPLDPIYGNALTRTWNWLNHHAKEGQIDFGIDFFEQLLKGHGENGRIPVRLLAPSASLNAPVMLPAYVDLWCQTTPRPAPDPDVSLFLHGPQRGEPDVQVCWRADIGESPDHPTSEQWADVVALLPPTTAECMSVPISRLRRWLIDQKNDAADRGDLLGVTADDSDGDGNALGRPALKHDGVLWRGIKDSRPIKSPDDLRPGDTLVLPVSAGGWDVLGHLPRTSQTETQIDLTVPVDCAEVAFLAARDRVVMRIHPALRSMWPMGEVIDTLFERLADQDDGPPLAELSQLLRSVADSLVQEEPERASLIRRLAAPSNLLRETYPDKRGALLMSRRRIGISQLGWLPTLDDGDDEPSRTRRDKPVTLADHTRHVIDELERALLRLPAAVMPDAFRIAAKLHDVGKVDERFQAMLRRADRTDAWLMAGSLSTLLAKSDGLPQTRVGHAAARKRAGLPEGFRHEMLSVQLVERCGQLPADETTRALVLHIIAAHHGYARPFAPVVLDDNPPDVSIEDLTIVAAERLTCPSHRLDSGITERFWALTRCFGWWGLAYLEALLRVADQQASAGEDAGNYDNTYATEMAEITA